MVRALDDEWQQHPPTHYLVAAYLAYKPPEPEEATEGPDEAFSASQVPWMAGMRAIPASPEVRDAAASDPMEALAAAERMFFGELKPPPFARS